MSKDNSLLNRLVAACEFGVYVSVNPHRDAHETVEEFLEDLSIDGEMMEKIKQADRLVEVQFYPRTSIGFHRVIHHDIDEALRQAVEIAEAQP